jgi:hypothetical protein
MAGINLNNADTVYTSFASSTSPQTFAVENGSRVALMVYNNSTANLFLHIDATATTSNFIIKLAAGVLYEMPKGYYTDKVTGVWDAANGSAKVIEVSTRRHSSSD